MVILNRKKALINSRRGSNGKLDVFEVVKSKTGFDEYKKGEKMGATRDKAMLFFVEKIAWFLAILLYVIFAVLRPTGMLRWGTLVFMIYSAVPLGFIVLAESVCLISGNFDLSVGTMTGFIGMVAGVIMIWWLPDTIPAPLTILLPLIIGLGCGALNGSLVGFLRLNPFLTTLGTYMIFFSGKLLIHPHPIYGRDFPKIYIMIGNNEVISLSVFAATLVVLWFVLRFTRFGAHLYAVGAEPKTASMLGINKGRMYFFAYLIAGFLCGMSALFYTGFLSAIDPYTGSTDLFPAFAAAVIGGISLKGGRGSVVNAVAGVILLGIIGSGLSMFAVTPYLRQFAYGCLVIVAIVINRLRDSVREKILTG